MKEKFYVTTPIYYVNSYPHLGHVYTTIIADTVARYKRQRGFEVFFLTGTDEHGINIERAAETAGVPVKQHVDRIVDSFKTAFAPFHFTNQHWVRTTDEYHKEGVRKLWQKAKENGWIYKGKYEGWYCGNCNEFYQEAEAIKGEGDVLLCPTHERPLELLSEESYFFKLSAFQDKLIAHYEANPHFIRPESRRNEVLSFVRSGLIDLSVSRVSVKWGIPVPDDPDHTMYVWFDALSNYITAIGYGGFQTFEQFSGEEHFNKFWPADLQLVGKDILRQHTVYWPAFLMATGLPLPKMVYSHGMWLSGGRKMSKTLGNVIDLAVLHKHFSPEVVRYFVLREMVFGQDGDFTYEALLDRVNADLASGLGNLASRTLTMVRNYCDGVIPTAGNASAELTGQAAEVREAVTQAVTAFDREFDEYNFSRAIEAVSNARFRVDKFISDAKPWDLAKDPGKRADLELVLHTAAESLRHFAALLAPVLPNATQTIWQQLGERGEVHKIIPANLKWGDVAQKQIGEVQPIFPRLDKKKIMEEIKQDEAASQAARAQETKAVEAPAAEAKPADATSATAVNEPPPGPEGIAYIGIEDFLKVELRVGEIKTAERIPKADKLLRFTIDLGEAEPRQILAGIAQYYEPEKLIGRKVIVVANLAPRKLRGLESQGMILAASIGEEGRPILAGFLEEVPNGAKLK
ncbi:MAG: methionine--tRNA ligase [Acidobacteria bacterium]|nr:methionine--tRNA ligase [Acidobacteriota bacterium]